VLSNVVQRDGVVQDSGPHFVFHYDGSTWREPSEWTPPPFRNVDPYEPKGPIRLMAGRITGSNSSEVFIQGDYGDQAFGRYAAGSVTVEWLDYSQGNEVYTSTEQCVDKPEKLWFSGDGKVILDTGPFSTLTGVGAWCDRHGVAPGFDDVQLPNQYTELEVFPDGKFHGTCLANQFLSFGNFASWEPNRLAVQYRVRAECNATGSDCRFDYDNDGKPECHPFSDPLRGDYDSVYARRANGTWNELPNADLVGVPCGEKRPYAWDTTDGTTIYAYDSASESWVTVTPPWNLSTVPALCETSYPDVPLPACNCQ
jgi:hypothetical protein